MATQSERDVLMMTAQWLRKRSIICGITSLYCHSKIIFWFIAISGPQSHHRVHKIAFIFNKWMRSAVKVRPAFVSKIFVNFLRHHKIRSTLTTQCQQKVAATLILLFRKYPVPKRPLNLILIHCL